MKKPIARVLLWPLALIALGAAAQGEPPSALARAAGQGSTAQVDALLARGADPNARGARGRTALMLAAMAGHYETVRLLLVRGAARDLRDDDGRTAFDLAVQNHPHGDIVALLRDAS